MEGGGWDDGGRSNPVPYYASTDGYSMLRNTYAPGMYAFRQRLTLRHDEVRLDALYFVGDLRRSLDL